MSVAPQCGCGFFQICLPFLRGSSCAAARPLFRDQNIETPANSVEVLPKKAFRGLFALLGRSASGPEDLKSRSSTKLRRHLQDVLSCVFPTVLMARESVAFSNNLRDQPRMDFEANELSQLVYTSAAVIPFDFAAISDILRISRAKNDRLGITGLLLYRSGSVVQVLEGQRGRVESLFETIRLDTRHTNVCLIYHDTISVREFPNWGMGFVSDEAVARAEKLEGETDYFFAPGSHPGRGARLLATFVRSTR